MKMNKYGIKTLVVLGLAMMLAAVALPKIETETTLIFTHELHSDMGIECESCHQEVAGSTSGTDNLMPPMDACAECHDVEDTDGCSMCHSDMENLDVVQRVIDYSPKFNHQVHVEQNLACDHCHIGVATSDSAAVTHLPGMEGCPGMDMCMDCHDGLQAPKECSTCHVENRDLRPIDHASTLWTQQHGDDAKMDDAQSCMMCHERNSCMECHEGDNIFFGSRAHPPGYEFKHPMDVRSGRVECASCHESRNFCAECHMEENVYPRSHQRTSWANRVIGGRHAVEARINIEQCTSCHGEETEADPVCAACHGN